MRTLLFLVTFICFSCTQRKDVDANAYRRAHENILIHHTKPDIKNARCIQLWDSALTYSEIGDFATSIELLKKCNAIEPNNGTILNAIGVDHFANGDSATALRYHYSAIRADSLKPEAYASAGCLLEMLGKYRESINILKLGYKKSNLNQFTHYNICLNLAITYYKIDSCAQVEKYLSIAKKHGFDEPQFVERLKQFEKEAMNYCSYYNRRNKKP